jgi:hypothetical protein
VGAAFGAVALGALFVVITLALTGAVLGIHALILGRVPGRWLQRHVMRPRVWGAGALLLVGGAFWSPTVAVIGVGLVAIGHVRAPVS